MKGYLVLEDGTVCDGVLFGFLEDRIGEVVFSTGMTGYQESLTDPSYCGQILVSSYPLIGNYGTNIQDNQSKTAQVWGYVVKEQSRFPSHRDCVQTIDEFLRASKVPGISGIDTRSLIRKLRDVGTMMGGITAGDPAAMLEKVKKSRNPDQTNLVASVSTDKAVRFDEKKSKTVAVFDCGVKESILVELRKRFNVIQLPFDAKPETVRGFEPDGIFITNGPGNPAHPEMLSTTVSTLAKLKEEYPMMGICLGNQLVSLMFGAKTYKLKFGHRGINQPVKFEGRVLITSQNHGFAVDRESAEDAELEVCFINLNDLTVEGIRHKELPIFSVQFHPEAHAGPCDSRFLFDRFKTMLEGD
ncbi:MAG: glutamine-hydrolyzing carbamoyl-phosphate synthase small subunit [Candidatus Thermoplasmatota archaeon]|nr:glutamine-hydrolyzing carbamoyl-phosphate synthase small subunit [Candidatus Thermoplasmatota archaeon]